MDALWPLTSLGGHLMGEALVFTTAEIVLGELRDVSFGREHCALSGWPELVVKPRPNVKK